MDSKKVSNKLARELSAVRAKKIERLRKKITSGQYQIKSEKLLRSLFFAR